MLAVGAASQRLAVVNRPLTQFLCVGPALCCCCLLLVLQPMVRKAFAALLVGMSGCVVWSSATIFTGGHPDLSPFSLAIRKAVPSEWGVQVVVMWPLAYICFCTGFALFR